MSVILVGNKNVTLEVGAETSNSLHNESLGVICRIFSVSNEDHINVCKGAESVNLVIYLLFSDKPFYILSITALLT